MHEIHARLELPLLDPQVRGEFRLVTADLLDEALGVLRRTKTSIESPSGLAGESESSITA